MGSIPGWGTKIPQASRYCQKNENTIKTKGYIFKNECVQRVMEGRLMYQIDAGKKGRGSPTNSGEVLKVHECGCLLAEDSLVSDSTCVQEVG